MPSRIWSRPCRCSRRVAREGSRTVRIPGVDLQPCGGTHLARTGEIGPLKVLRIRSEGKRNKRVTIAFAE